MESLHPFGMTIGQILVLLPIGMVLGWCMTLAYLRMLLCLLSSKIPHGPFPLLKLWSSMRLGPVYTLYLLQKEVWRIYISGRWIPVNILWNHLKTSFPKVYWSKCIWFPGHIPKCRLAAPSFRLSDATSYSSCSALLDVQSWLSIPLQWGMSSLRGCP